MLLRASIFAAATLWALTAAAGAQAAANLSGTIESVDGKPVSGADVTLSAGALSRRSRSAANGAFIFTSVASGTYTVSARAAGYAALPARVIDVRAGRATTVDIVLGRSATSLTTIARVRVNGAETVSSASAPSVEFDAQRFAAQGYARVSEMLAGAIGLTLLRPAGGNPAAPAVASLRGPDPTETAVDVDGHAVSNGNTGDFDLSLLDPAGFAGVQLVYGIAPSSLIGPNTIGGAINNGSDDGHPKPFGLRFYCASRKPGRSGN